MVNSEKQFSREQFRESRPNTLDIIKINGRWAQVLGAGSESELIRYLDSDGDGAFERINYADLKLVHRWNVAFGNLLDIHGVTIGDEVLSRALWGDEEKDVPDLKKHITVFGEYVDKSKE